MNPADVAQSALSGLSSSDLSIFGLFWSAHYIVKAVMVGLLVCSVWVWAIAIDKFLLYGRTKRAMNRFEQAFWSGQSLEELYRSLSSRPTHSMAALVRRRHAGVEAQLRGARPSPSPACRCGSRR